MSQDRRTPRHTLYAYVDGSDLDDVAVTIRGAIEEVVDSRAWSRPTWVVDQRFPPDESMRPGDLPGWDLGLNHELPDTGTEKASSFDDVAHIALRLDEIAAATGREFEVGLGDNETGMAEGFFQLSGRGVDLDKLRAWLGWPEAGT